MCLKIGGMKEGDYLVGIGDSDVKWSSHAEVITLWKGQSTEIADSKSHLILYLFRILSRIGHFNLPRVIIIGYLCIVRLSNSESRNLISVKG